MTQIISLVLDAESAFKDLAGQEDRIIHLTGPFTIVSLEAGMESGAPSIAIRIDLPDGRAVIQETSLRAFLAVADALKARYRKKKWVSDAEWALSMQPFAIKQFYSKLWPGARIIELDKERKNELAQAIDIGGADKMIQFPDGGLAFLGQRFRRPYQKKYDDFTLRRDRPSGMMTEFQKIVLALQRSGFVTGHYAYGHVNENEDGFVRMRILKFREFIEAVLHGELHLGIGRNPNGSSTFFKIPFHAIPARFFLVDYAEDKPQHKLSL